MDFLQSLIRTVDKDLQAKILLRCAIGNVYLKQKNMKDLRELLDETKELLESIVGADSIVNASFYLLSARFHKVGLRVCLSQAF